MRKRESYKVKLPEVYPLIRPKRNTVVYLEPNQVGLIGGLLMSLIVMLGFLFVYLVGGYSVSLSSFLLYSSLVFVVSYGVIGFLTYYGLLVITREQKMQSQSKVEEVKEVSQGEMKL